MAAGNPFEAPSPGSSAVGPRSPGLVRCGAWLALAAEIGLPVAREGCVWLGWVTVEGTRWLGIVLVVLQVLAASLLAWPCRRMVRDGIAVVGFAVLVIVIGSHLGCLQQRFVELGTRAALAGVEVSQSGAAALVLGGMGRWWWAALAWVGVAATALASAAMAGGPVAGSPLLGAAVTVVWLGGRLLRYLVLLRLGLR